LFLGVFVFIIVFISFLGQIGQKMGLGGCFWAELLLLLLFGVCVNTPKRIQELTKPVL
jgi:hypothetical protein